MGDPDASAVGPWPQVRYVPVSGAVLYDLYRLLPSEEANTFHELLGKNVIAETVYLIAAHLDFTQQQRFGAMVTRSTRAVFGPLLMKEVLDVVRAMPNATDAEVSAIAGKRFDEAKAIYNELIANVERRKLKAARERKSDPETIRRNVEICRLRNVNPKHWSQGRLAKHFKITPRAIRKILAVESKWRKLYMTLLPESPPTVAEDQLKSPEDQLFRPNENGNQ